MRVSVEVIADEARAVKPESLVCSRSLQSGARGDV
jgi:hypothetical protein